MERLSRGAAKAKGNGLLIDECNAVSWEEDYLHKEILKGHMQERNT